MNNLDSRSLHFRPSDWELLVHLTRFMTNNPLPSEICFENLYGERKPWEIFRNQPDDVKNLYFYTALKKKKDGGLRFERSTGEGKERWTWHGQDKGNPIYHDKAIVGYKKTFVYQKSKCDQNGLWLLKEYFLSNSLIRKLAPGYPTILESHRNGIVLCRLSRKLPKKK